MVALRSYSNLSSNSLASTFSCPRPPTVVDGDLLIFTATLLEFAFGFSALVRSNGSIASFTDLLTDGYSESGTAKQYVLDPGGAADRHFWWLGYKIAASEPAGYTINVKSSTGIGSFGCQANVFAFSGVNPAAPLGHTVLGTYPQGVFPFTLPPILDQHGHPITGKQLAMSAGGNNLGGFCLFMAEAADGSENFYVVGNQSAQASVAHVIAGAGLSDMVSINEGVQGNENVYLLDGGQIPASTAGLHAWTRF